MKICTPKKRLPDQHRLWWFILLSFAPLLIVDLRFSLPILQIGFWQGTFRYLLCPFFAILFFLPQPHPVSAILSIAIASMVLTSSALFLLSFLHFKIALRSLLLCIIFRSALLIARASVCATGTLAIHFSLHRLKHKQDELQNNHSKMEEKDMTVEITSVEIGAEKITIEALAIKIFWWQMTFSKMLRYLP